ncbi:MAG: beta-ketoacyl synthase chain length factor [Dokdonella sp.]
MNSAFTIKDWSAFAPGLSGKEEWMAWAAFPFLPCGDATPALSEMPPMQRRRVDKLGRMALQVAWWCQQAQAHDVPLVFSSRHGDMARTYEMLCALAQGESLSPTHFGLSTHNAIAAQYSIARQLGGNYLCVSAGVTGAEAAVIEALALLANGNDEVLVVVYDCSLPDAYANYIDEPEAAYAWAVRLGRPGDDGSRFSLEVGGDPAGTSHQATNLLPHGLEVLGFLIGDQATLDFQENGRSWRWQRHA